jgi:hypothetical protein
MSRGVAVVLAIVGLIIAAFAVYPSGMFSKFHGVGGFGSGHNSADVALIVGVILLVLGVYGLVRGRPAA